MKISVCGKGGSGKSVVTTLLAEAFKDKGYQVLVVDSDESNSSLYRFLGFNRSPAPLMDMLGGKKGLKDKMSVKFSSGEAEVKMEVLAQNSIQVKDIPSQHIEQNDGIKLLSIGKILHSLEGCACPMGVLSREFLKKLSLMDNEVVLVDMEAGVEHFGRGIETSIDVVIVVVEPSFESIGIAKKIRDMAVSAGINAVFSILNKINSSATAAKMKRELADSDIEVIATISYDLEIFESCLEGKKVNPGTMSEEMKRVVDILLAKA